MPLRQLREDHRLSHGREGPRPRRLSAPRHDAFIAPSAVIVGDVTLGAGVSVWHQAVIRGDIAPIVIGDGTNIQDGAILHVAPGRPCLIGKGVTVAHRVVLHGCTIEDDVLIGIGAIVLNGVVIGAGSVIAAGAVVTEGTSVPAASLVMGVPGRVVGTVDAALAARARSTAESYVERARAARLDPGTSWPVLSGGRRPRRREPGGPPP